VDDLLEDIDGDDGEEFLEGRLLTTIHKTRERSRRLRNRLLAARLRSGALACDLCAMTSKAVELVFEDAIFEAHHTVPISEAGKRVTTIRGLALLCLPPSDSSRDS
jgi:5-methylcytosine-specific restriction enzyme A